MPYLFNYMEHEPERGTTTIRSTVEEYQGLVVTTTVKIQRVHPERFQPRHVSSAFATVPNAMVEPTPEEASRGHFYRDGNLYVAIDVPDDQVPPSVVGVTFGQDDQLQTGYATAQLPPQTEAGIQVDSTSLEGTVHADAANEDTASSVPTDDASLGTDWDDSSISSIESVVLEDHTGPSTQATVAGQPPHPATIPAPESFQPPTEAPVGTRFYVIYVGQEVGIFWGNWYLVGEHKVLGVSGHRASMHKTFTQALVEYTRAYYGQKPGYSLRVATDPMPGTSTAPFNVGCAMGMGSSEPVALNNGLMGPVLARLIGKEGVQRMASYHNAAFSLWAPRLYAKYEDTMDKMYRHNPSLPRNFTDGVFSAATFNFSGRIWTYKHRDFFNWAFGWCFVTALGRFDPARGGQMILWELKLVVDFPHAATIALPSSVITHSNTPISQGDLRVSFTQYSAGPIFRWVENGCRTERQFEEEDPAAFAEMMVRKSTAYLDRLPLYSTLEELTQKA
ncbi:hypothetical protein VNI00_016501 [Paramarasmius palmivorus]|uniref:Uncharacterized protein n=1 Tax=Paramarasmius palmivorus TaxID=297713 RepID=A0AAW0BF48_9AGAR